jgi:GDP-4-dehydro-6-deoxy-D-mannose reductase
VVVTRSFNHTGPGQRLDFVAPALVSRVLEARRTGTRDVAVGNIDVRRDLGDVRDVARAYRLLLEGLTHGDVPSGTIVNVATGQAVSIRRVLEIVCRAAGHEVQPKIDPGLLRQNDPPVIVGDHALLNGLTGWEPRVPLETTLADLVSSLAAPEDPAAERSR